jgi:FkbM family methyltransferase
LKTAWKALRAVRSRVWSTPVAEHAAVFRHFHPYTGPAQPGFEVDFLGCRTRQEFLPAALRTGIPQTTFPPLDEEYPEWVVLLEAVVGARDRFVMLELGAGFGRWVVRAAKALEQVGGPQFHLIAVEAEPRHFAWISEHFKDNGIDPTDNSLIHAAVSDREGEALLYVQAGHESNPSEWYGQSLVRDRDRPGSDDGEYHGRAAKRHQTGWRSVRVPCVTLPQILAPLETVDLVDIDVQGEELKVVSGGIDELTRKARCVHIGTHGRDIERGVRKLFEAANWVCKFDFRFGTTERTSWGMIHFTDGVQTWMNPQLVRDSR